MNELVENAALRGDVRSLLGQSYDLERLAARVGTGRANPRDLVALARTLAILPKLKARLTARTSAAAQPARGRARALPRGPRRDRSRAVRRPAAGREGRGPDPRRIPPGLDELREAAKGGKSWIAKFQAEQVRRTGIQSLKVGYQQGVRLLHRDHACPGPGPGRRHSRRLHSQADGEERRAVHHSRAQGARGARAPGRGPRLRAGIRALHDACATGSRPKHRG